MISDCISYDVSLFFNVSTTYTKLLVDSLYNISTSSTSDGCVSGKLTVNDKDLIALQMLGLNVNGVNYTNQLELAV